jgi:integrase/recombinase XerD
MNSLSDFMADYLGVRRALGFKLEQSGKLLAQFVAYCDDHAITTITTAAAVAWATLPTEVSPGWLGERLSVVRSFAVWMQAHDPATEVPPGDVIGPVANRRAVPYLYTDAEVVALMDAAAHLRYPIEQLTLRTLVGLLSVTGMRIGEAIRLDRGDISWDEGLLAVEMSKFGKSRNVVLHPTSIDALRDYAARRDQLWPRPKASSFFLSSAGTRLVSTCRPLFHKVIERAGIAPSSTRRRPRLHDFRHTFAVNTLIDWHANNVDVEARCGRHIYMGSTG